MKDCVNNKNPPIPETQQKQHNLIPLTPKVQLVKCLVPMSGNYQMSCITTNITLQYLDNGDKDNNNGRKRSTITEGSSNNCLQNILT